METTRRGFLGSLIAAGVGFTLLPSATTYQRKWLKLESGLIVPEAWTLTLLDKYGNPIKQTTAMFSVEHNPLKEPTPEILTKLNSWFSQTITEAPIKIPLIHKLGATLETQKQIQTDVNIQAGLDAWEDNVIWTP